MYQALYRTWRPQSFADMVGQEHITRTLTRQVEAERLSHAYLFTGTRGTGKTTCAKVLAKAVNCEASIGGNPCNQCSACTGITEGSILDVLELDAASNNGVDQVRALREEAIYTPASVKKRVYIIDEVHMLSPPAFNALLKILEEPPAHVLFILATTELHKISATIRSRCQHFSFKRIAPSVISDRLLYVSKEEKIPLTVEGASLLARLANGGLRDGLSLLDQCRDSDSVDESHILNILGLAGNTDTAILMDLLAKQETDSALGQMAGLYENGRDISAILDELSILARDLLLLKTAPKHGESLLVGGYDDSTLNALGGQFSAPQLLHCLTILQETTSNLSKSKNRRTDGELCLLRICEPSLDESVTALSARISRLEEGRVSSPPQTQKVAVPNQVSQAVPPQIPVVAPQPPVPAPQQLPPVMQQQMPPQNNYPSEEYPSMGDYDEGPMDMSAFFEAFAGEEEYYGNSNKDEKINVPQVAPPVMAPQVAPPMMAPQVAPPMMSPQGAPPMMAPQVAPPVMAPQGAPPVMAPQVAPPVMAPQVAPPVMAPQVAPPMMATGNSGQYTPEFWRNFLVANKSAFSPMARPYLTNEKKVNATYQDGRVTLYTDSMFTKNSLEKAGVFPVLENLATGQIGSPVHVVAQVSTVGASGMVEVPIKAQAPQMQQVPVMEQSQPPQIPVPMMEQPQPVVAQPPQIPVPMMEQPQPVAQAVTETTPVTETPQVEVADLPWETEAIPVDTQMQSASFEPLSTDEPDPMDDLMALEETFKSED